MAVNNSLEGYDVFSWSNVGSTWDSFNTPFAFSVYKCSAIIFFIIAFDIIFLLGQFINLLLYFSPAVLLGLHDLRVKYSKGYSKVGENAELNILLQYSKWFGRIFYGYEFMGAENIPYDRPVVFYFYHGPFASDAGIAMGELITRCMGKCTFIASSHRAEVAKGGSMRWRKLVNYLPYTRSEVIEHLNEGGQYFVGVGGVEESRYSDNNYRVYFGNKQGLAHVLKAVTKPVAVLPIFTRNIQEAYWVPWFAKPFIKHCPKKYLYMIPTAGFIPVKLVTFVGKEIEYDVTKSPAEIMETLQRGMQSHIDAHQIVPGNKLRALRERFRSSKYSVEMIV